MLTNLYRSITDAMYGVKGRKMLFTRSNPAERIVFCGAAKGTSYDGETDVKRGANWIIARRAVLLLTEMNIRHGMIKIPLSHIISANVLLYTRMKTKYMVLRVNTKDGKHHQFGMIYDAELLKQSVLKVSTEQGNVKYSAFSIMLRIVVVILIAREIYRSITGK